MTDSSDSVDAQPAERSAVPGPHEVNPDVSTRQCIGPGFEKRWDYQKRTEEIKAGILRLPPHGTWEAKEIADWTADPYTSRNWQFQHHALRWLSPLRHAADDGDEAARQLWFDLVRSWVEQNPPGESASKYAWMDMADGMRAQELVFGWPLARTEDEKHLLLRSLQDHGDWLADPEHQSSGNHALHQDVGLLVVGSFFRREDWQRLTLKRMSDLFTSSFDISGANDEGSIQYHQLNLSWWKKAWERVALEGLKIPPEIDDRLHLAAEFLAHAVRPDGTLTPIGDSHLRKVRGEGWPELQYVSTLGAEGEAPVAPAIVAPNGYVFGRSGWGDEQRPFTEQEHYSVRFGPRVTHHAHQDRGAVTFYAGGMDWATDPGSYLYEPRDPFRRYFKSREGHNVVVVDGREYQPAAPVELERYSIDDSAHDFQLVDRNYEGVEIRRRVVFLPGLHLLVVADAIEADQAINARQLWHVEPGVKPRFRDGAVEMQAKSGKRLTLNWLGQWSQPNVTYADKKVPFGWVSRAWGEKEKAAVAETSMKARRGVIAAVLGDSTEDTWAVESSRVRAAETWIRVIRYGRVWSVTIGESGVEIVLDESRTAALQQSGPDSLVSSGGDDVWTKQRLAQLERRINDGLARVTLSNSPGGSAERFRDLESRLTAVEKGMAEARSEAKAAQVRERKRMAALLPVLPDSVPAEAIMGSLTFDDVLEHITDPLYLFEQWRTRGDEVRLDLRRRRQLFRDLYQRGYYSSALEVIRGIAAATGREKDQHTADVRASELMLLRGELRPVCESPANGFVPVTGRILHVVGKALPETQTGYTLRTHYLAQAQVEKGYDVHVMRQAGASAEALDEASAERDGVTYHLPSGPTRGTVTWDEWLQTNVDALRQVVETARPSILHCHSDYINQLIARPVADAFGLPLVYESRGFWEESWLSRVETEVGRSLDADNERYGYPDAYTLRHDRENQARADSDHVTTLAEVMREHILERGEDPERISVTPNGVLPSDFPVVASDEELRAELGFPADVPVIGYITSVVEYEGIDTLVSAFAKMIHAGREARLLLVGDGPVRRHLETLAENLGVAELCCFSGRIPHDQVLKYYSLIDVFVVPRKNRAVCRLVTPLKPFEAFSTGRAVVVSDVEALREIADQSQAAEVFRADDPESLAQVLEALIDDPERRAELAARGAAWARAERSWESIAARYDKPYQNLGVRLFDSANTVERTEHDELRTDLKALSRDEALKFLYVHGQAGKSDQVKSAEVVMSEGWGGHGFDREVIGADYDWSATVDQDRTWQMHMHSWEFMVPVLSAWGLTGSDHYMKWVVRRALNWGDAFSEITPDSMAWYDMALAYRSTTLQALIRGAAQSAAVSDEEFASLVRLALKQRDAHWEAWSFNPRNNHGYYSAVSQVVLARGLPGLQGLSALRHQGNERLRLMADTQFNADGGHVEHSPDYHRMLLTSFEGAIAVDAIDDPEVLSRVRKAADVLGWMVLPNGKILQMGDSPERDMRGGRSEISPATNWILTRGRRGVVPEADALLLPESGYAFIRPLAGNDAVSLSTASYLAMSAGFHSRTHKHCDDQSLVWMENEQEILIDGGRYRYGELLPQDSDLRNKGFYYADPVRQYMESCAAHSTLSIDGDMQDRRRIPYGGGIQEMTAHEDGSFTLRSEVPQNGWTSCREVNFTPGRRLEIRDSVVMADEAEHTLHSWFLLDGGLSINEAENGLVFESPRWDSTLRLNREVGEGGAGESLLIQRDQREGTIRGVRSRQDRELEAAWSLEYRKPFRGSVEAVTVFEFDSAPTEGVV
ncbi:heparinase II/III family protein [Kocuria palustris]|uniref:heparinase II/III domain-containing protein n=1 Tax=Kocuria palustris TaxID=71999 RepID=UPI003647E2E1